MKSGAKHDVLIWSEGEGCFPRMFSVGSCICDREVVTYLADFLECRHPGWREVTVLEQHPGSFLDSLLDHPDRDGSLTLT